MSKTMVKLGDCGKYVIGGLICYYNLQRHSHPSPSTSSCYPNRKGMQTALCCRHSGVMKFKGLAFPQVSKHWDLGFFPMREMISPANPPSIERNLQTMDMIWGIQVYLLTVVILKSHIFLFLKLFIPLKLKYWDRQFVCVSPLMN